MLPAYNVGKYIERCLLSCVNQTYCNIEIIVVDDCGQDDSIYQAEQFADKDSRVKIVRNDKNMGTYHARRIGVENSIGDYVLFLDPDDELEIDAVDKLNAAVLNGPDIVFYGVKNKPAKKFWKSKPGTPPLSDLLTYEESLVSIFSCHGLQPGTPGKLFSTNIIQSAYTLLNVDLDRRLVFGEDVLLYAAVLLKMGSCSSIEEPLYIYHENIESISQGINEEQLLRNIEQLNYMIGHIAMLPENRTLARLTKDSLVKPLSINRSRLKIKMATSFDEAIREYIYIFSKTRSLKDVFRIFVFMVTFGQKKL